MIYPFLVLISDPVQIENNFIWTGLNNLWGPISRNNGLKIVGYLIILVFLFKGSMGYLVQKSIVNFASEEHRKLRIRLMAAYQAVPYTFHINRNSASLIQTIVGHSSSVAQQTLMPSLRIISDLSMFVLILIFLAYTSLISTLSMAAVFLFVLLIYNKFVKKALIEAGKMEAEASSDLIKGVNQGLGRFKEIRVLGKEDFFLNYVKKSSRAFAGASAKFTLNQYVPRYIIESSVVSFIIGLVFVLLAIEENTASVLPTLGVFVVAAIRLMPSVSQIMTAVSGMRFSSVALEKVYHDLKEIDQSYLVTPTSKSDDINLCESAAVVGDGGLSKFSQIELSNIKFRYSGAKMYALNGVSLTIRRGESVGIVGESGAGKTTLVDVLLGLLEPEEGQIKLNGIPISINLQNWLDRAAYIPQNILLLDDTMRKNIALGVDESEIDDEQIKKATHMAQLQDVVARLPYGIDSVLGEGGVKLSGGQRQRVALACAFYHEREILIMDEATSALDNETEKDVVEAIKSLKGEKTLIVIAHRHTTVKYCDVIIQLHDGKVVKSGSYDEVIPAL